MLEAFFPASFELFHPGTVFIRIRDVDNQTNKIVAIGHTALSPMPLDILSFVARGTIMIDDFQNTIGKPLARNFASIVKLKRKKNFEAPPFVGHRSFFH